MHRKRRSTRLAILTAGFVASVLTVAALVTAVVVGVNAPSDTTTMSLQAPAATATPTLPATPATLAVEAPTLDEQLAAQATAEAQAQAAAEAAARAKAEADAKAKAEAEARAAAEAEAAAARAAAAEEAARSVERAIEDPKSAARALMADYAWGEDQFECLDSLWTRESNWRHTAENPSSGAYGIPQSLPASKMAEYGDDYRTNPITQIEWGLSYIDERYGTPCSAWGHSESVGWY